MDDFSDSSHEGGYQTIAMSPYDLAGHSETASVVDVQVVKPQHQDADEIATFSRDPTPLPKQPEISRKLFLGINISFFVATFLLLAGLGTLTFYIHFLRDAGSHPVEVAPSKYTQLSGVCYNNGTFVTTGAGYQCNCTAGFTGTNCENDFDDCSSNPCHNRSTCVNKLNGFQCLCAEGMTGQNCSIDLDYCTDVPGICRNNGTCKTTDEGYNCTCEAAFTGKNCEFDIDECATVTHDCHRNATCTNTVGGFSCSCNANYSGNGTACYANYCEGSPPVCQNEGNCTDLEFGYECACRSGFTGSNCEADIDECSSDTPNTCHNSAPCHNFPGGYYCSCNVATTEAAGGTMGYHNTSQQPSI